VTNATNATASNETLQSVASTDRLRSLSVVFGKKATQRTSKRKKFGMNEMRQTKQQQVEFTATPRHLNEVDAAEFLKKNFAATNRKRVRRSKGRRSLAKPCGVETSFAANERIDSIGSIAHLRELRLFNSGQPLSWQPTSTSNAIVDYESMRRCGRPLSAPSLRGKY